MIFKNQKIPVETEFTKEDVDTGETSVVDLTDATIRYDYWYPTNATEDPSGSVVGQVDDAALGLASGFIPASENTVVGDYWRVQAIAIINGDEWPACALAFEVVKRGYVCY